MKTKKIGKVDKFFRILFIKYYKSFFHLLGMALFVGNIFLLGFTELLTLNKDVIVPQLLLIASNFFMVNFLLEKLGINKLVEDEIKNLNSIE